MNILKRLTISLLLGSCAMAQQILPEVEKNATEYKNNGAKEGKKMCRVLSLSGGGTKGAYEAGALQKLASLLESDDAYYDIVSGVSVGAVNAAGMAIWGKGEEKQMADFLADIWLNMQNGDVYETWPNFILDPTRGILRETGFFNSQPLYNYLQKILKDKEWKTKIITNTVDTKSGKTYSIRVNDDKYSFDDKCQAIISSASIPFVFPTRKMTIDGVENIFMDGGWSWNNNMVPAIQDCLEMEGIDDESQIEIDVMVLDPTEIAEYQHDDNNITIENYNRNKDIDSYYATVNDVVEFMRTFPKCNYRYYVQPTQQLIPSYMQLNFDRAQSQKLIDMGFQDAQTSFDLGPGVAFANLERQYDLRMKNNKQRKI